MSKFYEIIKDECDFVYDMYILENNDNEKKRIAFSFCNSIYTTRKMCRQM